MNGPVQRILVSGASGLIGSALIHAARGQEVEIVRLVRTENAAAPNTLCWDPRKTSAPPHPEYLENFDGVIHLSGANLAHRWTPAYRQEIMESRVVSTRSLCQALANTKKRPRVLLCASAVGLYGDRGDEILTEKSGAGVGFLAETCSAWEDATRPADEAGIRVVHLRFGIVLDAGGGALGRMLPAFRLGLGGPMGSGRQWMSWISVRDVARAVFFLMNRDDLAGAFNVVAPRPVTNRAFAQALGRALHRPALLPAPRAALRLLFGSMADEALLASQRAVPGRLLESGFRFEDEEIEPALQNLLRSRR